MSRASDALLIPIDDPDDPRIADYRQVRERDLVGRRGGFIVEGEVVLAAAVRSGRCALTSLLLEERRVRGLAPILDALPGGAPVYVARQTVMDQIVGFPIHRGVLALGQRPPSPTAAQLLAGLAPQGVVLALFGIANHDNMGGLFRNAAALGAAAVLLAPDCCDPFYRKAIRVSVGAVMSVPQAWLGPQEDPVGLLQAFGFECLALSPSGQERLAELRPPARAAVLLGTEGPGLPAEVLQRARTVAIPMAGGFDSLNVAVAAGIVLHHLAFAS
jgi:tRNA G18 (ribose-2'-O)-methylase SpoU